jgi:hypothetical protein
MSTQPIYVVDDLSDDPKDPFPPGLLAVPPAGHAAGQWSSHTKAFGSKGLGAPHRTPIVTVLTPDHPSAPA